MFANNSRRSRCHDRGLARVRGRLAPALWGGVGRSAVPCKFRYRIWSSTLQRTWTRALSIAEEAPKGLDAIGEADPCRGGRPAKAGTTPAALDVAAPPGGYFWSRGPSYRVTALR